MKSFGQNNFQILCTDQKVPFWQLFRQGRDGRALLVQPSRIPHRISKNLFALGADDFLAMLEGKIREGPFFKVQSGKTTVCWGSKMGIKKSGDELFFNLWYLAFAHNVHCRKHQKLFVVEPCSLADTQRPLAKVPHSSCHAWKWKFIARTCKMLNKSKAQKTATSKKKYHVAIWQQKVRSLFLVWCSGLRGCYCMQQFDEFETIS